MKQSQTHSFTQTAFSYQTPFKDFSDDKSLLIFSDLDGTLLDHHTYSYAPAKPALLRLFGENIPLILNTSKTFSETLRIQDEFGGFHPFVVENGAAIIIPENYFIEAPAHDQTLTDAQGRNFFMKQLGKDYTTIRLQLKRLRHEHGFVFSGFGDMNDAEVAVRTSLPIDKAAQARARLASEPLLWQDKAERLPAFIKALNELDLTLIQGGRFWHVKSKPDKADAMNWLKALYEASHPKDSFACVALGDSPNDRSMLEQADIAVVVASPTGHHIELKPSINQYYTALPGPSGWEQAIQQILHDYSTKESHYG
jgi:mannosyl-3-phosphoglycerate phosphatase